MAFQAACIIIIPEVDTLLELYPCMFLKVKCQQVKSICLTLTQEMNL